MRRLLVVLPAVLLVTIALLRLAPESRDEPTRFVSRPDIHADPVALEIRARLIRVLGPDALDIVVGVEDNVAVISGEVRTRAARRHAEAIASAAAGIIVVHNFLELEAGVLDEEEIVEPTRRAAIASDAFVVDLMTPVGIEK